MIDPISGKGQSKPALTCIHVSCTVPDTQTVDAGEVEQLMVMNLIETLAEVALSVASRLTEAAH